MKKLLLSLTAIALLTACGSDKKGGDSEKQKVEVPPFKPVNQENIMGQWEVQDDDLLTDKSMAGKTIEFAKDSVFYFDENGNPVRRMMEFHKEYGPRIETVTKTDDGTVRMTNMVQMNFHEMHPEKLIMTENGKTMTLKKKG